ncbi:hypothetical protein BN1723_020134, partial [Verticillium longisporum]
LLRAVGHDVDVHAKGEGRPKAVQAYALPTI